MNCNFEIFQCYCTWIRSILAQRILRELQFQSTVIRVSIRSCNTIQTIGVFKGAIKISFPFAIFIRCLPTSTLRQTKCYSTLTNEGSSNCFFNSNITNFLLVFTSKKSGWFSNRNTATNFSISTYNKRRYICSSIATNANSYIACFSNTFIINFKTKRKSKLTFFNFSTVFNTNFSSVIASKINRNISISDITIQRHHCLARSPFKTTRQFQLDTIVCIKGTCSLFFHFQSEVEIIRLRNSV
ncbi:hypothetical protein D1872_245920 [compost metagenome]